MPALASEPRRSLALVTSEPRPSASIVRLVPASHGFELRQDFAKALLRASPQEVAKVTCMDWREGDRHGHLLTSAGAIVHPHMLDDLHLVIKNKRFLVLQGHSDCAKTRAEVPRLTGELDEQYRERVEAATLVRLWRNAARLLADPEVTAALQSGLRFCVAYHDVRSNEITFFERESEELIRSALRKAS